MNVIVRLCLIWKSQTEKHDLVLSVCTRLLHNLKTQKCILPSQIINQLNIKDSQSHDVCNPL